MWNVTLTQNKIENADVLEKRHLSLGKVESVRKKRKITSP